MIQGQNQGTTLKIMIYFWSDMSKKNYELQNIPAWWLGQYMKLSMIIWKGFLHFPAFIMGNHRWPVSCSPEGPFQWSIDASFVIRPNKATEQTVMLLEIRYIMTLWLAVLLLCILQICCLIPSTVYPKKYTHGFCFAVLCCGYTLTGFPISIRLTSLALWQSNDCPSASKSTLMNMDKYFMWIHYERLHNHNKAKHNKTVCIFLGIYCQYHSWAL